QSVRSGHHLLHCGRCVRSLWSSLVIPVSGHLLHCVRSLWSSPALCPQSLVISCTVSAVVISCTVSAVSGHLLYCGQQRSWSSPVLCLQ
ncbi:unnamed protein product, partial [Staurois parvus]